MFFINKTYLLTILNNYIIVYINNLSMTFYRDYGDLVTKKKSKISKI